MISKGSKLRKKGSHLVDKVLTIYVKYKNRFVCIQENRSSLG